MKQNLPTGDLRKLARDKPCMIRSPVCNGDDATTVLAHINGGIMGGKNPDTCGAWSCSACHDLVDGRNYFGKSWDANQLRQWHLDGVIRTLIELNDMK